MRILTGDTPTGQLHLGHWVGSVKRRTELQSKNECYFLIANLHAFTTRAQDAQSIYNDCIEITKDYLAMGINPEQVSIVIQSEIPALSELTYIFAMLLPFNRVMRNPTLKEELKIKNLGENYSFGFPLYAVGQTADILAFKAHSVPVGEDQIPHLELTREVARKFNKMYCGVNEDTPDEDHELAGGIFPIPTADIGKTGRLIGIDGKEKMSKSLGNAIFITDNFKQIKKKVGQIYTGRQSMTEHGDINNSLFQYVRTFIKNKELIKELEDKYKNGKNIGDGHVKEEVAKAINDLILPMRERRKIWDSKEKEIRDILHEGIKKANRVCENTLSCAKDAAKIKFVSRKLTF
tara:strand:+ start:157 stop:1203 length:1047 start_codon:yes stop_codon:yes gene_type:complete